MESLLSRDSYLEDTRAEDQRENGLKQFRAFFHKPTIWKIVEKLIPIKERILTFGDIEKDRNKIKNITGYIPWKLDKEDVTQLIYGLVDNVLAAAYGENVDPTLKTNLRRLAYRNAVRNLKLLQQMEGTVSFFPTHSSEGPGRLKTPKTGRDRVSSYRRLIAAATQIELKPGLTHSEKTGALMYKLIEGDEDFFALAAEVTEALDLSWEHLETMAAKLSAACDLIEQHVPELEKPSERGKIDPDISIRTLFPTEMFHKLAVNEGDSLGTLDEIQIHLEDTRKILLVRRSPYVAGARQLSRTLGRNFLANPMMTREVEMIMDEHQNDSYEFRVAKLVEDDELQNLLIYWPNRAMRPKKELSIVDKLDREPDLDLENMFDLWGGMLYVKHTAEEILKDEKIKRKIMKFLTLLMEKEGFVNWDNKYPGAEFKKTKLKKKEFKIEVKMERKDQGEKSNGFPVIKVYFRAVRPEGDHLAPLGIPCELQLIPIDTFFNMNDPAHPSHRHFYEAAKLVVLIRNKFSATVFPKLHAQATYIEKGLNIIKSRFEPQT